MFCHGQASKNKSLPLILALSLVFPAPSLAQTAAAGPSAAGLLGLPSPGTRLPPSAPFEPILIKGLKLYPDQPLRFDFIVDLGKSALNDDALNQEGTKLIKYFLASLTLPEKDLWVNLSPEEKDRIIPAEFGITEMGRDLLAQDYLLKQLTASLMYPEDKIGEEFWQKVYHQAQQKFGTTKIPLNTFHKVWIVPDQANVYVDGEHVFILKAHLKVLLEEDYVKETGSLSKPAQPVQGQEVTTSVVREVIVPAIEQQVNEGEHFALLRQIYHSFILAAWYKRNLKESILSKVYADESKMKGIELEDRDVAQKIYQQYLTAFKKGVFNFIREEQDEATQQLIPRKYFSGGTALQGEVVQAFHPADVDQAALAQLREDLQDGAGARRLTAEVDPQAPQTSQVSKPGNPNRRQIGRRARVAGIKQEEGKSYLQVEAEGAPAETVDVELKETEISLVSREFFQTLYDMRRQQFSRDNLPGVKNYGDISQKYGELLQKLFRHFMALPGGTPQVRIFTQLVGDLEGYASYSDRMVALYNGLAFHPNANLRSLALFHEVMEYAADPAIEESQRLRLVLAKDEGVLRILIGTQLLGEINFQDIPASSLASMNRYLDEHPAPSTHDLIRIVQGLLFGEANEELTQEIQKQYLQPLPSYDFRVPVPDVLEEMFDEMLGVPPMTIRHPWSYFEDPHPREELQRLVDQKKHLNTGFGSDLLQQMTGSLVRYGELGTLLTIMEEVNEHRDGRLKMMGSVGNQYHIRLNVFLYLAVLMSPDPAKTFSHARVNIGAEGKFYEFDRLLRALRIYQQMRERGFSEIDEWIQDKLQQLTLEEEWTSLKDVDKDEMIQTAIFLSFLQKGNIWDYFQVALDAFDGSLYVRKDDQRLYMRKEYFGFAGDGKLHPDNNHPMRERLAVAIGEQLGVNVVDTIIDGEQIFSALSVGVNEESLPQKTTAASEAATLVFDVFIRKWDDQRAMVQRSRVGDSFVVFDHDAGLNERLVEVGPYLEQTLGMLERAEERRAFQKSRLRWNAEDFDALTIWQTIAKVKALNVDSLVDSLEEDLVERLSAMMAEGEVQIMLEQIKDFLKATQATIEEDVKAVYKAFTGEDLPTVEEAQRDAFDQPTLGIGRSVQPPADSAPASTKRAVGDQAMLVEEEAQPEAPGGIDLNAELLKVHQQMGAHPETDFEVDKTLESMPIEGFVPRILQIRSIPELPLLLGGKIPDATPAASTSTEPI